MDKPKLPPIKLMLEQVDATQGTHPMNSSMGHQHTASDHLLMSSSRDLGRLSPLHRPDYSPLGGLPGHMQNLSISNDMRQSWNVAEREGMMTCQEKSSSSSHHYPPPTLHQAPNHVSQRSQHARSFSDVSRTLPSLTSPSASLLPPLQYHPAHHIHHRRAVSTNAAELMMQPQYRRGNDLLHLPYPVSSPSTSTSTSSTSFSVPIPVTPTGTEDNEVEGTNVHETESVGSVDDSTGTEDCSSATKHKCAICNKGFSRPSSLRIHMYSHTGEKPFTCTEKGCGRKFSVQSNMRRHLKIHRGGNSTRKRTPRNTS